MSDQRLDQLSEAAAAAHARIQQDFKQINPVIGISRSMRSSGFPVDVMTIDCLKTTKRIIVILNDEQPELVSYQFSSIEAELAGEFKTVESSQLTDQLLYQWISGYFGPPS